MVVRSQNITFNDTYVRDVKQWNWECHTVKNINYNNIKGLSPFQHAWVDGLDLTSGQGIHLNGAITMGNDDTAVGYRRYNRCKYQQYIGLEHLCQCSPTGTQYTLQSRWRKLSDA